MFPIGPNNLLKAILSRLKHLQLVSATIEAALGSPLSKASSPRNPPDS